MEPVRQRSSTGFLIYEQKTIETCQGTFVRFHPPVDCGAEPAIDTSAGSGVVAPIILKYGTPQTVD